MKITKNKILSAVIVMSCRDNIGDRAFAFDKMSCFKYANKKSICKNAKFGLQNSCEGCIREIKTIAIDE